MSKTPPDDSSKRAPEPQWLKVISITSTTLNKAAAGVSATLLVLMVSLILVEIVMRFFSRSTFMTDVLVGHGVAAITFLALGWALEEGSMIRISAVTQRLGRVSGFLAEAFSIILSQVIVVWLMYFVWRSVAKLWSRGTTSEHYLPIPLWIPETIFFVGLALLSLQLLVKFLRLITIGHSKDQLLKL
jgi:TRAP-type C4-dicarboxylate transport system permease small subunit